MKRLYLMITITNRVASRRFVEFYQRFGASQILSALGRGTASDDTLSMLGLEATEKAALFSIVTPEKRDFLFDRLLDTMQITTPGNGIALSLPLSSIGGVTALRYFTAGQLTGDPLESIEKEDLPMQQNPDYTLIVAIANRGYTDLVMDAAREAGAPGGTILHAKSSGADGSGKFFGMSLAEEREMIFLVVPTGQKNAVMQSIMAKAGMESKAQSLVSSLALDSVAGLYNVNNPITT